MLDFRPQELLIAVATAALVQCGAVIALRAANLDRPAAAPEIEKGPEVPVKVIPVIDLDAPALKLGGKKVKYKLPDKWVKQTPVQRAERKAFVSPQAGKKEEDIPPPDLKIADAGTEPPPPDAALAKEVDTEIQPVDAGPPSNTDVEGSPDGIKEGTETDPLKARAVDIYRQKIAAWFQAKFSLHGSGLPQEELTKLHAGATAQLSGLTVTGYSLSPSGNAAFDAAARAALESAKGQQIPGPPENYPDVHPNQISLTFVCRKDKCD